jgi:hypothetical protein
MACGHHERAAWRGDIAQGHKVATLQRRIELVVPVTIVTRGAITVGTINAGKVYYAIDMQVGWYPRH